MLFLSIETGYDFSQPGSNDLGLQWCQEKNDIVGISRYTSSWYIKV